MAKANGKHSTSQSKHSLRSAALKATFAAIDAHKQPSMTRDERLAVLDHVLATNKLKKPSGSLYDRRALYNALCDAGRHYVRPGITISSLMEDLFVRGSELMSTEFLNDIGYKEATRNERSCSSISLNLDCEGHAAASLTNRGNRFFCKSCCDWLDNEKQNLESIGCSDPYENPNCRGQEGYLIRVENNVYCTQCATLRYQKRKRGQNFPEHVSRKSARLSQVHDSSEGRISIDESEDLSEYSDDELGEPCDAPKEAKTKSKDASAVVESTPDSEGVISQSTTNRTHSRATAHSHSIDEDNPLLRHKQQRISDARENTVDVQMRCSEIAKAWSVVFNNINIAVVVFIDSANIKLGDNQARFANIDKSTELYGLYDTVVGGDMFRFREMSDAGLFHDQAVLFGLIGALICQLMARAPLVSSIVSGRKLECVSKTLEDLGYDAEDIMQRAAYAWVTSLNFAEDIKLRAEQLALDWSNVLWTHMKLLYDKGAQQKQPFRKCMNTFASQIQQAIFSALLLEARMRVVGAYGSLSFAPETGFDLGTMQELHQAYDKSDLLVTLTALPGITRKGDGDVEEIICKAVVACHIDVPLQDVSRAQTETPSSVPLPGGCVVEPQYHEPEQPPPDTLQILSRQPTADTLQIQVETAAHFKSQTSASAAFEQTTFALPESEPILTEEMTHELQTMLQPEDHITVRHASASASEHAGRSFVRGSVYHLEV